MRILLFAGVSALSVAMVSARPAFVLEENVHAAPGVPCNVYFERVFDSRVPQNYVLEAVSEVGRSYEKSWCYEPTEADAGSRHRLVLNAWDDTGLVASVTTTVVVASLPKPETKARKVTLALLAASDTNSRYQDQLRARMREAGFAGYTPVGTHTGFSASLVCDPADGAPHDGFGGFTWGQFMRRYAFSLDEIDNVQAEAEREQMKLIGEDIPAGQQWRKALLKSPLVRWERGKTSVDVQGWFDRINGGKAPDYILIALGGNEVWYQRPDAYQGNVDTEIRDAARLLDYLRAAAPKTRIAVLSSMGGSFDQDGWAHNYGSRQHCRLATEAFLSYNRKIRALCRKRGDGNLVYVPVAQNQDPIGAYPTGKKIGNGLHATVEGGKAAGDAIFAWLLADLNGETKEERK